MKLAKRFTLFALTAGLLVSAGCSNSQKDDMPSSDVKTSAVDNSNSDDNTKTGTIDLEDCKNTVVPIYDANNEEIGTITCYTYSSLVNSSILYTKLPEDNADSLKTLEYWLYDIEAKKDYKLATINDWMYEETYDSIVSDGHLYISVSTGGYIEREDRTQTIYDIDISEHSMSPILVIEGGIPYNSYTIADGKLILAELLVTGDTDLVEYDLNDKQDTPVIHAYDESDCFVRDSIRHIYADEENIYTIRLDCDENENSFLYMDIYDFDFTLLNSIKINEICTVADDVLIEEDKVNERKQFIANFFVDNDLFFYQNFSVTTSIGTIKGNKVERLFETDSLFSYVNGAGQCDDNYLFMKIFGFDSTDKNERNLFYMIDSKTKEIQTAEFYADNPKYTFSYATCNGDNKILLSMGYVPVDEGERLPDRLYYLDIDDLNFVTME